MRISLSLGMALVALAPGMLRAQAPSGALQITGTSSLSDWTCRDTTMGAQPGAAGGPAAVPTGANGGVTLTFPVGGIDCGNSKMTGQLRDALKASRYPTISFGLSAAEIHRALAAGSAPVRVDGQLTIAGETKPVQTEVTVTRAPGQGLQVAGEQSLKMTDFGVKPPVALLGLIKVRDLVHVVFNVLIHAATLGHYPAGR